MAVSEQLELLCTGRADVLALIMDNILCVTAEDTRWLIFLQNNLIAVFLNFQGILDFYVHSAA